MDVKFFREYNRLTQAVFMLPSSIIVGLGLGFLVDRIFHTDPLFTIALAVLGIVAGFISLYKDYMAWEKEQRSKRSS